MTTICEVSFDCVVSIGSNSRVIKAFGTFEGPNANVFFSNNYEIFCDSTLLCNMKYLCASFKTNCSSNMVNSAIINYSSRMQNFLKVVAIFVVMHTRAFMT
jgi:hypothetical protein